LDFEHSYERWRAIETHQAHIDPLYLEAIEASGRRSIAVPEKLENIFFIIKNHLGSLESQNIVEFGSYRGGSSLIMGYLLKKLYPGARLWSLDTFEGMPETAAIDAHGVGDFADADLPGFEALIRKHDLPITVLKGLCQNTFPLLADQRFGLAHIDVDIYSAVKYAAETAWDQMVPGGYLVFDDANAPSCVGATRAAEEMVMQRQIHSEQVWPHWVFRR
jgi:predicted O-methyltransferase YrrM